MKSKLTELLEKAKEAEPIVTKERSSWAQYLPVIQVLMDSRGFSLFAAVEWLAREGEINRKKQSVAYRSLRLLIARRAAKKSRSSLGIMLKGVY